jgi:hypothetical protein
MSKPQGIRRNTYSSDAVRSDQAGEFRDPRQQIDPLRRALGESFRDIDDQSRVEVSSYARELEQVYTEPMFLALPQQPSQGIVLARIRKVGDEEMPISWGGVSFWWDGAQSRAVITSIDGLTPDGSSYKFNFWVIG